MAQDAVWPLGGDIYKVITALHGFHSWRMDLVELCVCAMFSAVRPVKKQQCMAKLYAQQRRNPPGFNPTLRLQCE